MHRSHPGIPYHARSYHSANIISLNLTFFRTIQILRLCSTSNCFVFKVVKLKIPGIFCLDPKRSFPVSFVNLHGVKILVVNTWDRPEDVNCFPKISRTFPKFEKATFFESTCQL